MFKELIKYRDLLYMLTLRNIKVRYKQAAMGFLWAVFMPIMAILAGLIIKKAMSIVSGEPMDFAGVISISVKVLPWTFFISALKASVVSLVGNKNLVTKIYFPRAVLPFSCVLAGLFDFLIASLTLFVLLTFVGIGVSIHLVWVPVILALLIILIFGLGLLLSSANLFFRDVRYIVEVVLMFGIFYTPIFYDADMFGKWKTALMLNPMAGILQSLNEVIVLRTAPDMLWLGYSAFVSILIFMIGLNIFTKFEPLFAENI